VCVRVCCVERNKRESECSEVEEEERGCEMHPQQPVSHQKRDFFLFDCVFLTSDHEVKEVILFITVDSQL
jgi:hypothetical protein